MTREVVWACLGLLAGLFWSWVSVDPSPPPEPARAALDLSALAPSEMFVDVPDPAGPQRTAIEYELPERQVAPVLRERVRELEALVPIARLARETGNEMADIRIRLDRSHLIPTEAALTQAFETMDSKGIQAALDAEAAYYRGLGKLYKAAREMDRWQRQAHHDTVVAPWIHAEVHDLCDLLYGLRCPSPLVTQLRDRLLEDT